MTLTNRRILTSILFGLAIVIPPLLVIIIILRFGLDVPYWDDWAFVHILESIQQGRLTLNALMAQHNEHRMLFPRLLKLGLINLSDWNTFYELFASWTCIALSCVVLWDLLRITLIDDMKRWIKPFVVVNGFLLFSLAQGENFIWGWQLQWFLAEFFTILSIWALARWKGRWIGVLVAALAAFVTTYSIASGQSLWLLGLLVLLVERRSWRVTKILFWTIVGTLTLGFYFYHFRTQDTELFTFIEKPLAFIQFILASLGSPFGAFGPFGGLYASNVYGALGVVIFCSSTIFLWRRSSNWVIKLLPWMQLAGYGLMSIIATAVGRVQYRVEYHALVSRYSIFALLFWTGTLVHAVVCLEVLAKQRNWRPQRIRLSLAIFIAVLFWGYVNTSAGRYARLNEWTHRFHIGQSALYDYRLATDGDIKMFSPANPTETRRRAAVLETLRLGPYKNGAGPEIVARLNQAWLEETRRLNLVASEVRANQIYIVPGDALETEQRGKLLRFTVGKRKAIQCFMSSDKLPRSEQRFLMFQSQSASHVRVHWLSNQVKKQLFDIYGIPLGNGWRAFRLQVPTDVRGYAFAFFYTSDPPIEDKVKILVYDRLGSS
ncbi:hypothetical protein L0222_08270 [bacterium]|nr:hypothetical protein [bacterium]